MDRSVDRAVYIISVAAELAGVHPQTRTSGNTRRYSERDIERLQMIQDLTQRRGVNLAGAKLIMEMQLELERLRRQTRELEEELHRARRAIPLGPGVGRGAAGGIGPPRAGVR